MYIMFKIFSNVILKAFVDASLWGGGTPSKQRVIEKNFFYFLIVAEIRSDETPSIFNFKKGEIMKHPTGQSC